MLLWLLSMLENAAVVKLLFLQASIVQVCF